MLILFISIVLLSLLIGNIPNIVVLPKWLDFKPFNCQKCLTFWSNIALQSSVYSILLGLTTTLLIPIFGSIIVSTIFYILQRNEERKLFK